VTKLMTIVSMLAAASAFGCSRDRPPAPAYPATAAADPETTEPPGPASIAPDYRIGEADPESRPGAPGPAGEAPAPGEDVRDPLVEGEPPPDDRTFAGRGGVAAPRGQAGKTAFLDPGAERPEPVQQAIAVLQPTRGNQVTGVVRFTERGDGLEMSADVAGLGRGPHAFHVHIYGDCSGADGESAGEHFHFTGSSAQPEPGLITGDLGELRAQRGGRATRRATIDGATLQGRFSILGRSVVVHERGNDPTKTPDGGAGKRIACGVIGIDTAGAMPGGGAR
jgi:superoxide dismutase, Cu-Zn family